MNEDTMKDIINDVRDLASVSDAMTRLGLDGLASRLEKLVEDGLCITPKKAVDAVEVDVPPASEPVSPDAPEMKRSGGEKERDSISRAETVRILMQLQGLAARDGHPNINAALEMAIAAVLKRHRDTCRNKAKRRAARMANSAAKEVA